jgi:hypothetical protein
MTEVASPYSPLPPWRFFFDLDGFVVDFDREFQKVMPGVKEEDDWLWEDLHKVQKDIYLVAPRLDEGFAVLTYLEPYWPEWYILTAIPRRWNWPDVTKHKRAWVNREIPQIGDDQIRFGPYAEDKQFHCTGKYDVLIDDKLRNIEQWTDKGGTGIHFKGNAQDAINQLQKRGI